MTKVVHVPDNDNFSVSHDVLKTFKLDVHFGLTKSNKQINSKYFYDECGSDLFNQITRHVDYYLTPCEIEILNMHKEIIAETIAEEPFNLVELGPGEGIKTNILIDQFVKNSLDFNYIPIDISTKFLKTLIKKFNDSTPKLQLIPIHADYFRGLEWLGNTSERRNLVLFLGSSIGNFDRINTEEFLLHLWDSLKNNDHVLIGFDLRKDVDILMAAYNDKDGLTRDFNLNLLSRINRELCGNFQLDKFRHYSTYNVYTGAMESYLISLEKQIVKIEELGQAYHFEAIEPIHVENSFKYNLLQIDELAKNAGFSVVHNFLDKHNHFVDTLWKVSK